jgi:hypothetical protein
VKLGIRHGLAPLMQRSLTAAAVEVPRAAAAGLWARAEWAARRGRDMLREIERIATALQGESIPFVSFKGPLFAQRLHGDVGLRESGDLDFLVPPSDARRARKTLEALGYGLVTPLDARREELWLESPGRHELAFAHGQKPFLVELQWRANPDLAVPAVHDPDWWGRAPQMQWRGLTLTALPPEEELIAMLVHGTKHLWGSLDWLVDIAETLRRVDAPWRDVIALARRHRAVRRVALGFELASTLLAAPLPVEVTDFVREARLDRIVQALVPWLTAPAFERHTVVEALRLQLALLDTPTQRVACLLALSRPTPGDWEWMRLPRGLGWVYWALRPARLAWKYAFNRPNPRTPAAATPRTPPPRPRSTS